MGWPSIGEYNAAFQNPEGRLLAPSLAGARCKLGPMRAPMPVSGGYALIYEVSLPGGGRKAVRCFTEEDPARLARAAAACAELGNTLARAPSLKGYFAATTWEEGCVKAGGRVVPAMVMDWIEGQTLGPYIEARHGDAAALRKLRERLAALVRDLEANGIVHGDLQTGNLVVTAKGGVKLLDYDGLGFSRLPALPELESGHPNFQHPAWSAASPRERKDRFPAIAIDLGLAALIERPGLFGRFSTGENILFVGDDYAVPEESGALEAVRDIPALARAAELFAGLCGGDPALLPSLADFRAAAYPAETRMRSAAAETETAGGADPTSAEAGAPAPKKPGAKAKPRERGPYAGPYPVLSGADFHGIHAAVGRKIEVVGRIVSVKADGLTKYGDPFAFVNFADWRGNGFKLTIWSEGLASLTEAPSAAWEGRWVSAVGLVDEPYRNDYYGYTQLSITIQDSSQLRFLDAAEAGYRLGGPAPKSAPKSSTHATGRGGQGLYDAGLEEESFDVASNAGLVASLAGSAYGAARSPSATTATSRRGAAAAPTSNEALLAELAAPSRAHAPSTCPQSSPAGKPSSQASLAAALGSGCLRVLLWLIAGIFILAVWGGL